MRDAEFHTLPIVAVRRETADARDRMIEYLVENFDELVYV